MTRHARWLAPVAVVAGIAGSTVGLGAAADAAAPLPPKTPAEVIAMIADSDVQALSGTVSESAQLGLPQLPGTAGAHGDAASLTGLLSGSSTLRVEVDGPERARVQVLGQLAETDLVRNGRDVWTYSSAKNAVTHLRLPARPNQTHDHPGADRRHGLPDEGQLGTPQELARSLVDAITPSTQVDVDGSAEVAGRGAYDLRIRPRDSSSLLEQASVAVDGQTGLPLRVRLQARGQQDPAFELAYTDLQLRAPAAKRFRFSPPPGAKVEEKRVPAVPGLGKGKSGRSSGGDGLPGALGLPSGDDLPGGDDLPRALGAPGGVSPALFPQVFGSGWTSVLAVPAAAVPAGGASPELDRLLASSTRPVPGGRLLHTALLNVLVTDDGRWLVGAVTPDVLQAAASRRTG